MIFYPLISEKECKAQDSLSLHPMLVCVDVVGLAHISVRLTEAAAFAETGHVGLLPGHDATRVHKVEENDGDQHGQRVQAVLVGLLVGDRAGQALRVLDDTEDDTQLSRVSYSVPNFSSSPGRLFSRGRREGVFMGQYTYSDEGQHDEQGVQKYLGLVLALGDLAMQAPGHATHDEDEQLLQAHAAHVDVETLEDVFDGLVAARGAAGAVDLHDQGDDVEHNEDGSEVPGPQAPDGVIRGEIPHHATEDHVDVGGGPEGRDQDQDEPGDVGPLRGRVLDADSAEHVGDGLGQGRQDDDEAVGLAVEDGLADVNNGGDAEEGREEDRGRQRGTELVPQTAGGGDGRAAHGVL